MVGNVGKRIIAALRNRQFFSLHEINQAISEYLAVVYKLWSVNTENSGKMAV